MSSYQIISDTACDMPLSELQKHNIGYVPFSVSFDSDTYYTELLDLDSKSFFEKIEKTGAFPKTSQPTIQQYLDAFAPYIEKELDILCLCLSSKLSGSYQSAINAKQFLEEENCKSKIQIIDTTCATGSENLILQQAIAMRDADFTIDQQVEALEKLKTTGRIFFTVDSLDHLQKGGRIGKVSALAGSILNVKPVIFLTGGELVPHTKVRGQKKALQTITDAVIEEIKENKNDYVVSVLYGSDEFLNIAENLIEQLKNDGYGISDFPLMQLGITIGSHVGPSAIGICCAKKYTAL
ncbi:MAG: DegV family protein [Bacillota bacterium]